MKGKKTGTARMGYMPRLKMNALCIWVSCPGKELASNATAARFLWVSCPAKDVRGPQMCLGEIQVWTRVGSIPMVEIWERRVLAPPGRSWSNWYGHDLAPYPNKYAYVLATAPPPYFHTVH